MFGLLIFIHIVFGILLIAVILLQSGRSGGLTEAFGGAAETLFGTKTNVFMLRATAVLSTLFIISCLLLAYVAKEMSKSVMEKVDVSNVIGEQQKPQIQEEAAQVNASPSSVATNASTNSTASPTQ